MKCGGAAYHPVLSNSPNPISWEFCHHGRDVTDGSDDQLWSEFGCKVVFAEKWNKPKEWLKMKRLKKREMPPSSNILQPFPVLTTATQLLIYPAAVKTRDSAVNHDRCPNTMRPLAFGDEAGKYKRCCSLSAIITSVTTSDRPVFVEVKDYLAHKSFRQRCLL